MLKLSSTSAPLTTNPLVVSRCPLTDMLPGLTLPEGEVLVQPDISTALGCCELTGTTPACNASRSVKARPLSGASCICFSAIVSPSCVDEASICAAAAATSTVVLSDVSASRTSKLSEVDAEMTTGSANGPKPGASARSW